MKKKKEVGVTGVTKQQAIELAKLAQKHKGKVKIISVEDVPQQKKLH